MMFPKIFQVTLVIFVVMVSFVFVAVLLRAAYSMFAFPLLSHTDGIVAVSGGISARLFNLAVLAAAVVLAGGVYVFTRRRKSQ